MADEFERGEELYHLWTPEPWARSTVFDAILPT